MKTFILWMKKLKVNDVVSHLRSMADMEFKIMSTWSNSFLRVEKTERYLYKNGHRKKLVKFSPKIHNLVEFTVKHSKNTFFMKQTPRHRWKVKSQ